jgi:hypothetical protein
MDVPWYSDIWSVWGSSSSDGCAVGTGGQIFHYDGSKWSRMPSGTVANFIAVWGFHSHALFAAGAKGTILHSSPGN